MAGMWGYDSRPLFAPQAIATEGGWVDPDTGEIYVAIRQLRTKRREFIDENLAQLIVDTVGEENIFLTLSPDDGDRPVYLVLQEAA